MTGHFTKEDEKRALFMPLLGGARSAAADDLVDALLTEAVNPRAIGKQRRPSSATKARAALGALLGDLCRFHPQGRNGKHGMAPKDFPSATLGFGRTAFILVRDALEGAGLLRVKVGWNFTDEGFDGGLIRFGGSVTIFGLSPKLVERLGELCGPDAAKHWFHGRLKVQPVEPLLSLRSRKDAQGKWEELPIPPDDPVATKMAERLTALNGFLDGRVGGVAFAGVRRTFNDGDMPEYRWRRGGRFYSRKGGEPYEMMGEIGRVKTILLDGEIVGEVDIRASHLSVIHALLGLRFDPQSTDPYACGGIHREAVKVFLTASFGLGHLNLKRWSPRSREAYFEKSKGRNLGDDYKVDEVRSAVLARYPFLASLEDRGINSLDLQWHEAEVLGLAMEELMAKGIPTLPVHDALLVPQRHLDNAKAALRRAFVLHFGNERVIPALSVTYGGPMAEAMNI